MQHFKNSICHDTNAYYNGGQVLQQKFRNKSLLKMKIIFFCDDGAFLFNSRSDAILGTIIIFNQMKRMGFNIHVGGGNKASKTEAVCSLRGRKGYVKKREKEYFHQKNIF